MLGAWCDDCHLLDGSGLASESADDVEEASVKGGCFEARESAESEDLDLQFRHLVRTHDLPVLAQRNAVVVVAVGEDVMDAGPEEGLDRLQLVGNDGMCELSLLELSDQFRFGVFGVFGIETQMTHSPFQKFILGRVVFGDQVVHQEEQRLQIIGNDAENRTRFFDFGLDRAGVVDPALTLFELDVEPLMKTLHVSSLVV